MLQGTRHEPLWYMARMRFSDREWDAFTRSLQLDFMAINQAGF